MSSHIPNETIQEVISRSDIVELIQTRIRLIKRGGHNYVARCPFHEEKTPSFSVNSNKQFYYCFGCGASGNVVGFLMAHDHMNFVDAITYLAGQQGIELNMSQGTGENHKDAYTALQHVTNYYRKALRQNEQAIQYLKSRHLSSAISDQFALGYAPAGWNNLQQHLPINPTLQEALLANGLLISKPNGHTYDRFRQRIIFPIHNLQGHIIAFGGRSLGNEQPKYLNSPETPLFHKNRELYGFYQAKQSHADLNTMIVVEGYMDVITLHQHGFTNAVATMGTAINVNHIQKLLRYTKNIIFCFDGDEAGKKAAWKALLISLSLLQDGIDIRFLLLPQEQDPDSLLNTQGANHFQELLTQTTPLTNFFFRSLQQQIPLNNTADKARFAKEACELLNSMPPGIYQHLLLKQLTELLRVDQEQLQRLIKQDDSIVLSPSPPSTSRSSQPLSYHAITLLLQKPELAQTTSAELLNNHATPEKLLLLKIVKLYQERPELTIAELFTLLESGLEQKLIGQLAIRTLPIPEAAMSQEYLDTITRILEQDRHTTINQLINKAKQTYLNADEKQLLTTLLTRKHKKNINHSNSS